MNGRAASIQHNTIVEVHQSFFLPWLEYSDLSVNMRKGIQQFNNNDAAGAASLKVPKECNTNENTRIYWRISKNLQKYNV